MIALALPSRSVETVNAASLAGAFGSATAVSIVLINSKSFVTVPLAGTWTVVVIGRKPV